MQTPKNPCLFLVCILIQSSTQYPNPEHQEISLFGVNGHLSRICTHFPRNLRAPIYLSIFKSVLQIWRPRTQWIMISCRFPYHFLQEIGVNFHTTLSIYLTNVLQSTDMIIISVIKAHVVCSINVEKSKNLLLESCVAINGALLHLILLCIFVPSIRLYPLGELWYTDFIQ